MKKIITTFFSGLIFSTGLFAQGFHAGVNFQYGSVWVVNQEHYGGSELEYKLKLGAQFGLSLGYNFSEHLGVQTNINLSHQGQDYESSDSAGTYVRKLDLHYMNLPVLFKFVGGASNARFYTLLGPQFAFLSKADNSEPAYNGGAVQDYTERFNKTDVQIFIGLGTEITLTDVLVLNAGLHLTYGFSDINASGWQIKNHSGVYDASYNATGGINIGLHYLFGQ